MTDADILAGIHEAAFGHPAWAALGLESPLGDLTRDLAPGGSLVVPFEQHFGIRLAADDVVGLAQVGDLVTLLRRKFRED
jgi:hypothetical protein